MSENSDTHGTLGWLEHEDAEGGDPVCWSHLLCPECGAVPDAATAGVCDRCGAALGEPS